MCLLKLFVTYSHPNGDTILIMKLYPVLLFSLLVINITSTNAEYEGWREKTDDEKRMTKDLSLIHI